MISDRKKGIREGGRQEKGGGRREGGGREARGRREGGGGKTAARKHGERGRGKRWAFENQVISWRRHILPIWAIRFNCSLFAGCSNVSNMSIASYGLSDLFIPILYNMCNFKHQVECQYSTEEFLYMPHNEYRLSQSKSGDCPQKEVARKHNVMHTCLHPIERGQHFSRRFLPPSSIKHNLCFMEDAPGVQLSM